MPLREIENTATTDSLQLSWSDGGHFHKPQIAVVPVTVGQIDFERPSRGRANQTTCERSRGTWAHGLEQPRTFIPNTTGLPHYDGQGKDKADDDNKEHGSKVQVVLADTFPV